MKKIYISAQQLGLAKALAQGDEKALFKWLVASVLFSKPIQQAIAWQAYQLIVEKHRYNNAPKLASCSRPMLAALLSDAHYIRYDYSTADTLIKLAKKLLNDYGGRVNAIREQSHDRDEFSRRLLALAGIGPRALDIFMRDAEPLLFPPLAEPEQPIHP